VHRVGERVQYVWSPRCLHSQNVIDKLFYATNPSHAASLYRVLTRLGCAAERRAKGWPRGAAWCCTSSEEQETVAFSIFHFAQSYGGSSVHLRRTRCRQGSTMVVRRRQTGTHAAVLLGLAVYASVAQAAWDSLKLPKVHSVASAVDEIPQVSISYDHLDQAKACTHRALQDCLGCRAFVHFPQPFIQLIQHNSTCNRHFSVL
jgi:hypothetical protein